MFPLDADTGGAADWLNQLRQGAAPVMPPEGDSFGPADVAKLLGVTVGAVGSTVKRHGLAAFGNGKVRRLPRATVEALVMNRAKGCGPTTINHHVRAVRGFFRWMVKARRVGSNPLESLTLVNASVDVRRATTPWPGLSRPCPRSRRRRGRCSRG
ncbi:MAG: hypothetical protein U0797_06895 [Gemmataceae bacterium]